MAHTRIPTLQFLGKLYVPLRLKINLLSHADATYLSSAPDLNSLLKSVNDEERLSFFANSHLNIISTPYERPSASDTSSSLPITP